MTLESALYAIGTADATLNALIAGRMYREVLPGTATVPALVYRQIDIMPHLAHDGDTGTARARYQVDCWDDSIDGTESLQTAVKDAYIGYRGTADGQKIGGIAVQMMPSFPQVDTALKRRIVDLLIWDEG